MTLPFTAHRYSNTQDEPNRSIRRHAELGRFIRTLNNYIDDFGDDDPTDHMADITAFRDQLERVLSMLTDKNAPDTKQDGANVSATQAQNGPDVSKPKDSMDKSTLRDEPPTPPPATLRKVGKFVKVGRQDIYGPPRYNDSQV